MNKLFLLFLGALAITTFSLASREQNSATSFSASGGRNLHDSLGLRDILRILVHEERRRVVLEEEGTAVLRRIQDRQDIASRVIARRMTLQEAAVAFRSLNAELREEMLLAAFPGATEEERLCRQVILWVANALLDEPDRKTAEVGRLEAELKQYLHCEAKSAPQ